MRWILATVIFFLTRTAPVQAENALILSTAYQSEVLGPFMDVWEDPAGKKTLDDAISASREFVPTASEIPLYSFSKTAYWFRFMLKNEATTAFAAYLQIGCPWLDSITLFQPAADGTWTREEMGDRLPFGDRREQSILPTFALEVAPGKAETYYLRVQTSDAFIMPIFLRSEAAHDAHERLKEFMSGSLFGLIGVMFVFNLIVFIFSRDIAYVVYSINLFAWFSLFFTLDGYAYAWLWPNNAWWTDRAYVVSIALSTIWGTLFAKEFLRTFETVPRVNRVVNIWLCSQVLLLISIFILPYPITLVAGCVSTVFFCVMVPPVALLVLRRGFYAARFYLCSWIFPSVAAFYYLAIIFGFIPANGTNIYILHGGIAMEVIMLSVALGDRMRKLAREKQDLQQGLEIARVVQESFLLRDYQSPQVSVDFIYRPSDALGGDWFACLESADAKRIFVCLGDVTGHGIATSLITGSAAGSFQTAVHALPPDLTLEEAVLRLAQQLNDTILRIGRKQNAMMTCALVVIELDTLASVYLNAGHTNIFVKESEQVRALIRRGSMLGFSTEPKFHPMPLPLADDDLLILYSDGILENDPLHKLNPKSLSRIIEKSRDEKALKTELERFIGSENLPGSQEDDSTFLMIRLRKRQEPRASRA